MTTQEQETPEETTYAALPASERRGVPGHDSAADRTSGANLMRLRMMGMTYEQMAQEAGYADGSGARQALLRALDRHEAENATQLRHVENLRMDADERVLRTIIGDSAAKPTDRIRAIDSRTRLSARRARLNGLDAPVQVQLSAGIAADLEDALRELEEAVVPGEVTDVHDDTGPDA